MCGGACCSAIVGQDRMLVSDIFNLNLFTIFFSTKATKFSQLNNDANKVFLALFIFLLVFSNCSVDL